MPEPFPTDRLCTGQVGYIITGMKSTKNAQIGDTWFRYKQPVEALPGFKPSKSMVFAGEHFCLMISQEHERRDLALRASKAHEIMFTVSRMQFEGLEAFVELPEGFSLNLFML